MFIGILEHEIPHRRMVNNSLDAERQLSPSSTLIQKMRSSHPRMELTKDTGSPSARTSSPLTHEALAHLGKDGRPHLLADHLHAVGTLARGFEAHIEVEGPQRRDHSTAGALLAVEKPPRGSAWIEILGRTC